MDAIERGAGEMKEATVRPIGTIAGPGDPGFLLADADPAGHGVSKLSSTRNCASDSLTFRGWISSTDRLLGG